jgi:membrane protease YdiL (CAAX protease family)
MDYLTGLHKRIGSQLRERKFLVATELLVILLIPLLWGLLPFPRTIIPLFFLAWLSLWLRQITWKTVGLNKPGNWFLTFVIGFVVGILAVLIGILVISPLFRLVGQTPPLTDTLSSLQGNLPLYIGLLISTWLLAAVLEEMVYRGYLLNRLTDIFGHSTRGWTISVIISAIMFCLAHGRYEPQFLFTSFLAGIFEGWLYLTSRHNLWLPIVFHGVTNSISITMVFLSLHV